MPEGLTSLSLGAMFNQPVAGFQLPPALTHLDLGAYLCQPVNELQLPPSLLRLSLPSQCNVPAAELSVRSAHLTSLSLPSRFNQPLAQLQLPPSLTRLNMGNQCEQPMGPLRLPPNLRSLELATCFGLPLMDWQPPSSLTELTMSKYWNLDPRHNLLLPPALKSLRFGERFDEPVDGMVWPPTLTRLHLGAHFTKSLRNLPASLTSLTISEAWNRQAADIRLPVALTSLTLEYEIASFTLLVELRHLPLLRTLHLQRGQITEVGWDRSHRASSHVDLACVPAAVRTLMLITRCCTSSGCRRTFRLTSRTCEWSTPRMRWRRVACEDQSQVAW